MIYLDCTRNGRGNHQQLDVRACMACNCLLKTRKNCIDVKGIPTDVVVEAEAWLDMNKHTVHLFAARLLKLKYKGSMPEGEQDVKVQGVRQDHDRTRIKTKTNRTKRAIRGAMLEV